jgi:hypothetical protein
MIKYLSVALPLLILCFTACLPAHHQVKPSMDTISEQEIPKLTVTNSVTITGKSQEENKVFEFCSGHYAKSNDLTESAVDYLKKIFKKNNTPFINNGNKQIVLTATDASCSAHFSSFNFKVKLKVNAGKSIEKEFESTSSVGNSWSTTWAIEKAISNAVRKMLEDPDILQYLHAKPIAR